MRYVYSIRYEVPAGLYHIKRIKNNVKRSTMIESSDELKELAEELKTMYSYNSVSIIDWKFLYKEEERGGVR